MLLPKICKLLTNNQRDKQIMQAMQQQNPNVWSVFKKAYKTMLILRLLELKFGKKKKKKL